MEIPFASVGSLYFKKYIPPHSQGRLYQPGTPDENRDSETYCIGPIADYMFWYGKRAKLDLDTAFSESRGVLLIMVG